MSDLPTGAGGGEDDFFSDSQLTDNLTILFSEGPAPNVLTARTRFFTAFLNLTGLFTVEFFPTLQQHIGIDHVALQVLMERFHRDAFGVKRFVRSIEEVDPQDISPSGKLQVIREVKSLGIRINTDSPRLTKVVAAFSLWMSVLRPVHVKMSGLTAPHVGSKGSLIEFSSLATTGRPVGVETVLKRSGRAGIEVSLTFVSGSTIEFARTLLD